VVVYIRVWYIYAWYIRYRTRAWVWCCCCCGCFSKSTLAKCVLVWGICSNNRLTLFLLHNMVTSKSLDFCSYGNNHAEAPTTYHHRRHHHHHAEAVAQTDHERLCEGEAHAETDHRWRRRRRRPPHEQESPASQQQQAPAPAAPAAPAATPTTPHPQMGEHPSHSRANSEGWV
jgi:hypothetical protein